MGCPQLCTGLCSLSAAYSVVCTCRFAPLAFEEAESRRTSAPPETKSRSAAWVRVGVGARVGARVGAGARARAGARVEVEVRVRWSAACIACPVPSQKTAAMPCRRSAAWARVRFGIRVGVRLGG